MQSKFADNKYDIAIYDPALSRDGFSEDGAITTGVYTFVYDAGTKTLSTIYGDGMRTALANPITRAQFATDTRLKFFGAASSYDIVVNDDKGNTGTYPGVTPKVHSVNLNRTGADKVFVFPMLFNSGGTVVDTGLDLPAKAHVHNVAVEVVTVDATETVDIGILATESGGDEDGFIAAMSVASAGFIKPYVTTAGGNETYVSTAKYGVLMGPVLVGTDVDKDMGQAHGWGHVGDGTAKSITYTPSTSDTFAGYGYVYFKVLR